MHVFAAKGYTNKCVTVSRADNSMEAEPAFWAVITHPGWPCTLWMLSILPYSVNGPSVFSGSSPIRFFREYVNEKWKAHTPTIHYGNKYLPSLPVCLGTAPGAKDGWVNTTEAQQLSWSPCCGWDKYPASGSRENQAAWWWHRCTAWWGMTTEMAPCDWLWMKGERGRESLAERPGRAWRPQCFWRSVGRGQEAWGSRRRTVAVQHVGRPKRSLEPRHVCWKHWWVLHSDWLNTEKSTLRAWQADRLGQGEDRSSKSLVRI